MGYAPGSGFALSLTGPSPNQGHSPKVIEFAAARHSLASHQAAKPELMESSFIGY